MIGRLFWWAALACLGIVTAGLQLDKQSEVNPELARLVPAPFRNFAQTHKAANAAKGNEPAIAVAEAERLVQRRPLPAEYLTLLAVAQARAGKQQNAAMTIQVAGQRGWRDPVAQEALLRLALSAGDQAEAARRYTALLLQSSVPDDLLRELGPAVLSVENGTGETTMAAIVRDGERWHNLFLRRGPLVMPPAAFARIAGKSMARGATFDCLVLSRAVTTLAQQDRAASQALRTDALRLCPDGEPETGTSNPPVEDASIPL